ncbi:MAG: hypothetical protein JOY69_05980 [Candidatus Eremiobacteraeota bacterium]|nr:hypothetical protein [Candidatus Eremiobacteraeota bacterium]
MFRYLLLATTIVVAVVIAVAGWTNRDLIRIKLASAYGAVAPKPEPRHTAGNGLQKGLNGDAPWALSALPECLEQRSEATGPLDFLRRHLPSGATELSAPATLRFGDCTIRVVDDEAFVRRGDDRFHIPPRVRFYQTARTLAMLRETTRGNELRVYEPLPR